VAWQPLVWMGWTRCLHTDSTFTVVRPRGSDCAGWGDRMEIVVIAVVAVVGVWIAIAVRTRRIVKRHAKTLSARTGLPVDRVYDEMVRGGLTPGQWASRHGLDPLTFQPSRSTVGTGAGEPVLPKRAKELWARVRLDADESCPQDPTRLERIGTLQESLAALRAEPTPLSTEVQQQHDILAELYRLGARVDAQWVNQHMDADGVQQRLSQDDYDSWQRDAAERTNP
jgi:hypothetical protein